VLAFGNASLGRLVANVTPVALAVIGAFRPKNGSRDEGHATWGLSEAPPSRTAGESHSASAPGSARGGRRFLQKSVNALDVVHDLTDTLILRWTSWAATLYARQAMPKHSSHILELARKGAECRYAELKAEIASLVKHFPHLRTAGRPARIDVSSEPAATIDRQPRRRRRKMSAAARRKISLAQKRRWAKQKSKAS